MNPLGTEILPRAALSSEPRNQLQGLLERADIVDSAQRQRLGRIGGWRRGREVLLQCVQCHDLRTVLIKPRTPANWRVAVEHMANRSIFVAPIDDDDQLMGRMVINGLEASE